MLHEYRITFTVCTNMQSKNGLHVIVYNVQYVYAVHIALTVSKRNRVDTFHFNSDSLMNLQFAFNSLICLKDQPGFLL